MPVGDVDGMARRALELLCNEQRMSDARRAAVERSKQYSAEMVVPLYEQLYERVIAQ